MSAFDSESSLAAFIREQIDRSTVGTLIRQLQGVLKALAGKRIAFGTGTVNFSTQNAASSTFAHGLSDTPVFAIAGTRPGGSLVNNFYGYIADVTVTNLQVNAEYKADTATTFSGTWKFYWFAIG